MVDHATSRGWSQIGDEEPTWAVADAMRAWVEKYGVPRALYVDWKNVYLMLPPSGRRRQESIRCRSSGACAPSLGRKSSGRTRRKPRVGWSGVTERIKTG